MTHIVSVREGDLLKRGVLVLLEVALARIDDRNQSGLITTFPRSQAIPCNKKTQQLPAIGKPDNFTVNSTPVGERAGDRSLDRAVPR